MIQFFRNVTMWGQINTDESKEHSASTSRVKQSNAWH